MDPKAKPSNAGTAPAGAKPQSGAPQAVQVPGAQNGFGGKPADKVSTGPG